jgi:hypothetical protein
MICDVILRKEKDKYVARIKEWPEIMVKESSRDKAISRVKSKLLDYLTNKVELIKIEVPFPAETGNPWLDKFGWFKDDPTFDDLETEIASYRLEIDQKLGKLDK